MFPARSTPPRPGRSSDHVDYRAGRTRSRDIAAAPARRCRQSPPDRQVCQPTATMVSRTTPVFHSPLPARIQDHPAAGQRGGAVVRLQGVDGQRWGGIQGNLVADEATVEIPLPVRIPPQYDDPTERLIFRRRHWLAKPVRRLFLLALVACLAIAGWSVVSSLTAPGTDTTAARVAEWAR